MRWEWSGAVRPGQGVRIDNPFGDIRTRFGGYEGGVEIHAVIQNLHPGDPELRVLTETDPSGLTIRVERKVDTRALVPPKYPDGAPEDRVDLVVRVPKGAPVTAETAKGTIEAKGLKSDLTAVSESGRIVVREVDGVVRTRNRFGTTEVSLVSPKGLPEQVFESQTGDITVVLPPSCDLSLRAETSSDITTDISLHIEHRPKEEPSKIVTAKVGSGASKVALLSKRGHIRIYQREDLKTPAEDTTPGARNPAPDPH